jgi:DUF1365 family protein
MTTTEPALAGPDAVAVAAARSPAAAPMIGTGVVRHRRLRPAGNAFEYRTFFWMLPMRRLRAAPCAEVHRNRFGLLAFHDRDHGDGGSDSLAWIEALLAEEGIHGADGEIWLQTYPRVLGHVFKPVSFWYVERADGSLAAVVAEVNNTFGERHCYLLAGSGLAYGRDQRAAKVFHVSPFSRIDGSYRFRFMRSTRGDGPRCVVRIDHEDALGPLLQTSLSGRLEPLTAGSARAAFFGVPLMSFGVVARIHWQALRVWLKRVPYVPKPAPPGRFVTR